MNKPNYNILTPFKRWTIQNFPFIEEDFDAITNYQLLCKIVEYLNKVIENEKELEKVNNELIDAFNNLKSYVDNYFENLDVQDEIDNKLDEMAESGQLTDIIAQYLGLAGVLAFNIISDMSDGENLTNGSICYCLGANTYNDGRGAFYKVRQITSSDVVDGFNIVALDISNTLIAERLEKERDMIVFIGDSWTTEYPTGTNMWYMQVAEKLNLTPVVLGDGGSGFIHVGAHGTFDNQVTNAINNITNKKAVKIIAVTGGINDYHDENVTASNLRNAVSSLMARLNENFPNSEIVFTPLNYSYETETERTFEIYDALKSGALPYKVTILTGCYNWIKTFPQSYAYYDTHMNQTGNNIFATSWLSTYHGIGYNHTHKYIAYPQTGFTVLNAKASVVGSKVSVYAQLQVATGTELSGNTSVIKFENNVVGIPLNKLSARPVLAWINLQTSSGSVFQTVPAYMNINPFPNTQDNQGELSIIVRFPSVTISNTSSYVYISCDIDTALTD